MTADTMNILRVENHRGEGPYTTMETFEILDSEPGRDRLTLPLPDEENWIKLGDSCYCLGVIANGAPPPPWESNPEVKFGFMNKDQLYHWFPKPTLAKLKRIGFVVKQITIDPDYVAVGEHQVIFNDGGIISEKEIS